MIDVVCPQCGQIFNARDSLGSIQCPNCSSRYRMDSQGNLHREAENPSRHVRSGDRAGAPLPDSLTQKMLFTGYEILDPLGEGGMGVVYKAWQTALDRVVAIKIMKGVQWGDPELRTRFLREVRTAGHLKHPCIVPVYDAGEHEGVLYYTMEFVEGVNIKDYVFEKELDFQRIVEILARVAEAIGYAHEQGVVHRDLKPANIIVGKGGRPRILDFGLAKWSVAGQEDGGVTVTGLPMGTPGYMSPEQSMGKWEKVDARSDIFSFGILAYELLSGGTHPFNVDFAKDSAYEVIKKINEVRPKPLMTFCEAVDITLWEIIRKALQKDPDSRYRTASELAERLRDYLKKLDARTFMATSRRRRADRIKVALFVLSFAFIAYTVTVNMVWRKGMKSSLASERWLDVQDALADVPALAGTLGWDAGFAEEFESNWLSSQKALLKRRDWKEVLNGLRSVRQFPSLHSSNALEFLKTGFLDAAGYPAEFRRSIMKRLGESAGNSGGRLFEDLDLVVGLDPEPAAELQKTNARKWALPVSMELKVENQVYRACFIPAGAFLMGKLDSDPDAAEDEQDLHWERVSRAFYIGATEVTLGQFRSVMGEDVQPGLRDDLPVFGVSYLDAEEFCRKLSVMTSRVVRLPTEAEWEYACRSGSLSRFFPGGEADSSRAGDYGWFRSNSAGRVHVVAAKKPSPWGLHDMMGNVEEWCSGFYHGQEKKDGGGDSLQTSVDKLRTVRGGSWLHSPLRARSSSRSGRLEREKWPSVGFRIVLELK